MSRPLFVITPDTTCSRVLLAAEERAIHHFPIVERGSLVGFVCTCDLRGCDPNACVMRFAWKQVVSVSPRCGVVDAARLMLLNQVGSLVVADHLGAHGIITSEDLRQLDARAYAILEFARCTKCGAGAHLRPGPGGAPICVKCQRHHTIGAAAPPIGTTRVATG